MVNSGVVEDCGLVAVVPPDVGGKFDEMLGLEVVSVASSVVTELVSGRFEVDGIVLELESRLLSTERGLIAGDTVEVTGVEDVGVFVS